MLHKLRAASSLFPLFTLLRRSVDIETGRNRIKQQWALHFYVISRWYTLCSQVQLEKNFKTSSSSFTKGLHDCQHQPASKPFYICWALHKLFAHFSLPSPLSSSWSSTSILVNKHASNPAKNVLLTTGSPSLRTQQASFKIWQDHFSPSCILRGLARVTNFSREEF